MSLPTKYVVESARKELKPLPEGNAKKSPEDNSKKSPHLTTIVPKRQVENVTFVTPASMTSKEQHHVKKSACI